MSRNILVVLPVCFALLLFTGCVSVFGQEEVLLDADQKLYDLFPEVNLGEWSSNTTSSNNALFVICTDEKKEGDKRNTYEFHGVKFPEMQRYSFGRHIWLDASPNGEWVASIESDGSLIIKHLPTSKTSNTQLSMSWPIVQAVLDDGTTIVEDSLVEYNVQHATASAQWEPFIFSASGEKIDTPEAFKQYIECEEETPQSWATKHALTRQFYPLERTLILLKTNEEWGEGGFFPYMASWKQRVERGVYSVATGQYTPLPGEAGVSIYGPADSRSQVASDTYMWVKEGNLYFYPPRKDRFAVLDVALEDISSSTMTLHKKPEGWESIRYGGPWFLGSPDGHVCGFSPKKEARMQAWNPNTEELILLPIVMHGHGGDGEYVRAMAAGERRIAVFKMWDGERQEHKFAYHSF